MRSRNMEEGMTEERLIWSLGVDGRLLIVYILSSIIIIMAGEMQFWRRAVRNSRKEKIRNLKKGKL